MAMIDTKDDQTFKQLWREALTIERATDATLNLNTDGNAIVFQLDFQSASLPTTLLVAWTQIGDTVWEAEVRNASHRHFLRASYFNEMRARARNERNPSGTVECYHQVSDIWKEGDDLLSLDQQEVEAGKHERPERWQNSGWDTDLISLYFERSEANNRRDSLEFRQCGRRILSVHVPDWRLIVSNNEGTPAIRERVPKEWIASILT